MPKVKKSKSISRSHAKKWLVLDAHGVLLPSSERVILRHLSAHFHVPLWILKLRWLAFHIPSQTGKLESKKFYSHILRRPLSQVEYQNHIVKRYKPFSSIAKPIQAELQRLKKDGWNLALLSNMNDYQAEMHRENQTFKGFDEVFFSWEHKNMKPFPDFFLQLQGRMRVPSNHILFIDDHWENILMGMVLGWNSIKLKGQMEVHRFLKDLH